MEPDSTTIPSDIWQVLLSRIEENEILSQLNGRPYLDVFPFLFESYADATTQFMRICADLGGTFPRIRFMNRRRENPLAVIFETFQRNQMKEQSAALKEMSRSVWALGYASPEGGMPRSLTLRALQYSNLSQTHKARQRAAAAICVENIRKLRSYAEKIESTLGFKLAVRPPWCFTNQYIDDIFTFGLPHFDTVNQICSMGQEKVWDVVSGIGLDWLFSAFPSPSESSPIPTNPWAKDELIHALTASSNDLAEAKPEPIFERVAKPAANLMTQERIDSYFGWWAMNATAVFMSPSGDEGLAIAPNGMHPLLFESPNHGNITIFSDRLPHHISLLDSVYHFHRLPIDAIDRLDPVDLIPDQISPSMADAAYVLELILANYHVFVNVLSMGRGHHRPSWLQSPANIDFVNLTEIHAREFLTHVRP